MQSTRISLVLSVLLMMMIVVGCDEAAQQAAAPVPPRQDALSQPLAGPPLMLFEDEVSFATYARTLEPYTIHARPGMRGIGLTPDGRWAVGAHFRGSNFLFWTTSAVARQPLSRHLDTVLAGNDGADVTLFNRDRLSRLSPDGNWGVFAFADADAKARWELWRLPKDADQPAERFHTFDAQPRISLKPPSISPDGRTLLLSFGGNRQLYDIDALQGTAHHILLPLPVELLSMGVNQVTFELGPAGQVTINHLTRKNNDASQEARLGFATASLVIDRTDATGVTARLDRLVWLERDSMMRYECIAISPDGRHMVLSKQHIDELEYEYDLWRLPEGEDGKPVLVTPLPQASNAGTVVPCWSADGKWFALVIGDRIQVFDFAALLAGDSQPVTTEPVPLGCIDLRFIGDAEGVAADHRDARSDDSGKGGRIVMLHRNGATTTVPLGQPREVHARIGEARIVWDVPRDAPATQHWPALRFKPWIKHPNEEQRGQIPSTLILEVDNHGTGPASQVRATVTIAPALHARNADTQPINELGLLHLGTIQEGLFVKRFLDLPMEPALFDKARRFSVKLTSRFGFDPAPIHWLHLPRTIHTEEAYHDQAKAIFESASQLLIQARGQPFGQEPKLLPMGKTRFGFMVSFGNTVIYQNPFVMDDAALRVNRAVMQVDSQDDLMRHGQMMLFWYLPHELVHCADHRTGWATEFVANMVQPYLTAKMLETMPDAPYDAQSMSFIYDRYVQALRPHLSDEDVARIERFIAANGEGAPPWNMSASDLFSSNTPAYVYFGARINQHSWSQQSTLEALCKRYLSPKEE